VSNNIEPREERSLLIYFSQINDLPIMYQVVYSIPSAQDSRSSRSIQPCTYLSVFLCISLFTFLFYRVHDVISRSIPWQHYSLCIILLAIIRHSLLLKMR